MSYGTKYRLDFSNHLSEGYYVFFKLKDYVGDVVFITGTAGAIVIKSLNNDDDRFATILSKECTISMYIPIEQNISIENFMAQQDDQWNVMIYRELASPPIFNGFIVVDASSQPLLDRPYQLTLRASDGLSLLKNVPLKRIEGSDFTGLNNVTDYIGHALHYLNPEINFRIYFDFFHVEMLTQVCPLEQMQLYAKTFEKTETTFEDCFTVLNKICKSLRCRIFFENGCWHIVSLWQYYKDSGYNYMEYTTRVGYVRLEAYKRNDILVAKIGNDQAIYAINKDATLSLKLAAKSVKETYPYEAPIEIVCNQSFVRGLRDNTIGYDIGAFPNTTHYQGYNLDCWSHRKLEGLYPWANPTKKAYIMREYDEFYYEKDRYAVLPTEANNSESAALLSEPVYVGKGDRISVSVETRLKNNYNDTETVIIFAVLLTGDDGSLYSLDGENVGLNGNWTPLDSFSTGITVVFHGYSAGTGLDKTEWINVSIDSNKIPVNGTIKILLNEHSHGAFPNESWFKNVSVAYHPYINNSFKPAKGDYNIYLQSLKINKTIEDETNISDSPKKILKGAIHVNNNLATPEWKIPDRSGTYRFAQIMALVQYNFSYRQYRVIEGTLKGLSLFNSSLDNIPFGFLPQYSFTDIPNQPSTKYILTSMEVNYVTGTWRGVLVQVEINSSETFSTYDFQYLFE